MSEFAVYDIKTGRDITHLVLSGQARSGTDHCHWSSMPMQLYVRGLQTFVFCYLHMVMGLFVPRPPVRSNQIRDAADGPSPIELRRRRDIS